MFGCLGMEVLIAYAGAILTPANSRKFWYTPRLEVSSSFELQVMAMSSIAPPCLYRMFLSNQDQRANCWMMAHSRFSKIGVASTEAVFALQLASLSVFYPDLVSSVCFEAKRRSAPTEASRWQSSVPDLQGCNPNMQTSQHDTQTSVQTSGINTGTYRDFGTYGSMC